MKSLLKNTTINSIGLYILPYIFNGFVIQGDLKNLLIAAFVLTVLFLLVKPILSIITFPINALTFGAFSFVVNAVIFYLLTVFVPYISISAFTFEGASVAGFVIPSIYFSLFFAYIIISVTFSALVTLLKWIFQK